MHVHIYAPSEDLLAGRVLETVRSAAPAAEVTLTTDAAGTAPKTTDRAAVVLVGPDTAAAVETLEADPVLALVLPDGRVPESVPRVDLDLAAPEPALEALAAWTRAVAAGDDPAGVEGVSLGRVAGAAAIGGLAGLLLGGLLGDDGEPPFGGGFV